MSIPTEVILVPESGDVNGPEDQYQRKLSMTYDKENMLIQFDQYGEETFGTLEPVTPQEWEKLVQRLERGGPVRIPEAGSVDIAEYYQPEYPGEPSVLAMEAAISTSQTWPMRNVEQRMQYVDRVRRLLTEAGPIIAREAVEAQAMTDGEIAAYASGVKQGTQMFIDLALGENHNHTLGAEDFDRLRFTGPSTFQMITWMEQLRKDSEDPELVAHIESSGRLRRELEGWGS